MTTGLLVGLSLPSMNLPAAQSYLVYFWDIERVPVLVALKKFAAQTNEELLFETDMVQGRMSRGLKGTYSSFEALQKLLQGTGLNVRQTNDKVFLIYARDEVQSQSVGVEKPPGQSKGKQGGRKLEEVVVTGSHIRGARNTSPLIVFDREDIDKTGVSTTHDFFRTLGQHFRGGESEHNANFPIDGVGHNISRGSGINLRGLGTDSTLVLLQGHRYAATDFGSFADVSLIPFSVVERIDVLPDGASAVYGSDAVGGVVNIQLRTDYEGSETRIRYGSDTSGNLQEALVGHTWGKSWDSGHLLVNYEHYQHSTLSASDRSFTRGVVGPYSLLPGQHRQGVYLSGQRDVSGVKTFTQILHSERSSVDEQSRGLRSDRSVAETDQLSAVAGAEFAIAERGRFEIKGIYGHNKSAYKGHFLDSGEISGQFSHELRIGTLDLLADGILKNLPSGEIKIALGGQYRREVFEDHLSRRNQGLDGDRGRDVVAVFSELSIPLLGNSAADYSRTNNNIHSNTSQKSKDLGDTNSLVLSLAFRHESYSDFGESTNPKLGLCWSPGGGVQLRANYGTSFRAPLLSETINNNLRGFLIDTLVDSEGESPVALFVYGNNPDLNAETATTWTLGADISPPFFGNGYLSLNYFDIEYRDRIIGPAASYDVFTDPKYAPIITTRSSRDFDPTLIDLVASQPLFSNFTDTSPDDTDVIVDNRLRNMAKTRIAGIDLLLNYNWIENGGENWDVSFGGTYLIKLEQQLFDTEHGVDVVDTIFNPVDLELRFGLSWAWKNLSANTFVNYTDSYKDNRRQPTVTIDSWTTVNANVSYRFETINGLSHDFLLRLNVENLFNKKPPRVNSQIAGISYDPNNAVATGRFVSLTLTKHW